MRIEALRKAVVSQLTHTHDEIHAMLDRDHAMEWLLMDYNDQNEPKDVTALRKALGLYWIHHWGEERDKAMTAKAYYKIFGRDNILQRWHRRAS